MSSILRVSVAAALAFASSFAFAQSFSANSTPVTASAPNARGACGLDILSQSTSQVPVVGSVSCNTGGVHGVNSYFRAYSLAAYPAGFTTCGVQVGIETANAGGAATTQPVTVNVFSNTGAAFPGGTRVQVGTATVEVMDQSLSVLEIPVTGTVPAGAELVVEVLTPDGAGAGHSFFIGSNAAGQSAPSYLQAPTCGVTTPTSTATIGFPNMHIIVNPVGAAAGTGTLAYSVNPVNFGAQNVGATSVRTLTLSNTGTAALQVSALDAAAAPFARTGGTCSAVPISIAAGANCTIIYSFTPTTAGSFEQVLALTTDGDGGGPITLSARGVVSIALPAGSTLSALLLLLSLVGVAGVVLARRN